VGVFILLAIALVTSAIAVWRVSEARYRNARPEPRHVRARGEARSFHIDGSESDMWSLSRKTASIAASLRSRW
jgi:hypothetical protein